MRENLGGVGEGDHEEGSRNYLTLMALSYFSREIED